MDGTDFRPIMRLSLLLLLTSRSVVHAQPSPEPTGAPPVVEEPAPAEQATTPVPPTTAPAPASTALAAPEPVADKPTPTPSVTWKASPGKGATLEVGDAFSLNLRSRINLRYQLHTAPVASGDRRFDQLVNVNTVRLWFSGHVRDPKLTYMIQLALGARDYRDGAVSPIFDAFIDYKAHRDASIKVGQFFVPFDRLRTVREFALQLADRPRPVTELTLDRDVGVTLYSDNFLGDKSPVAYRLSAFGGGGTNIGSAKEAGGLVVARIELRPLGKIDDDSEGDLERRVKPAVAIGVGVATNRNTNRLRSTTGSTFTGGTTDYNHLAIDAVFKWRGFAFEAEYLKKTSSQESLQSAADPLVLEYTRAGSGVVLQASYLFATPIELVGRFARLYAPGGTDPKWITEVRNLGQEVAGGVNYYVAGHQLKLQADWIVRSPRDGSFDSTDHVVHAQLDATF
jgi:phosphate-selective porin OprO and OprP